ncbi:hypothetical protein MJO29_005767 [Puccinia striiformis f. sp. tritici]|nr:hypothetical protein MJO29_016634 [Puccinia striiformis f. sp. tritici]KAI7960699.1 hypothetical protein MJO29_005767 [Puccinia striiformis f. sp. tritici]
MTLLNLTKKKNRCGFVAIKNQALQTVESVVDASEMNTSASASVSTTRMKLMYSVIETTPKNMEAISLIASCLGFDAGAGLGSVATGGLMLGLMSDWPLSPRRASTIESTPLLSTSYLFSRTRFFGGSRAGFLTTSTLSSSDESRSMALAAIFRRLTEFFERPNNSDEVLFGLSGSFLGGAWPGYKAVAPVA